MDSYQPVKLRVEKLRGVTTRPMFGYQCYSTSGKFFVGFNKKNDNQVIVRLPKETQEIAIKSKGIKPFSHGAKMGWIEMNTNQVSVVTAMKWIEKGYTHATTLAKKSISKK